MTDIKKEKLLKNRQVIEEINRHLWLESEKAGHNIGFERAAEDWLNRYAASWVKFHMPGGVFKTQKSTKKTKKKSK